MSCCLYQVFCSVLYLHVFGGWYDMCSVVLALFCSVYIIAQQFKLKAGDSPAAVASTFRLCECNAVRCTRAISLHRCVHMAYQVAAPLSHMLLQRTAERWVLELFFVYFGQSAVVSCSCLQNSKRRKSTRTKTAQAAPLRVYYTRPAAALRPYTWYRLSPVFRTV